MGHYNNATICLNGHVVSKYQANYQKFCSNVEKKHIRNVLSVILRFMENTKQMGLLICQGVTTDRTIAIIAEHHILGQKLFQIMQ